jgi:hypothetical protein
MKVAVSVGRRLCHESLRIYPTELEKHKMCEVVTKYCCTFAVGALDADRSTLKY